MRGTKNEKGKKEKKHRIDKEMKKKKLNRKWFI